MTSPVDQVSFQTSDGIVEALSAENGPSLQLEFEADPDFFELVQGSPPGPAEATSVFVALPEGAAYDQKHLLGLFGPTGELLAVVDAIADYPAPQTWSLGLLFVAVGSRNVGVGRRLLAGFECFAAHRGATCLRLAIVAANTRAVSFFRQAGFVNSTSDASDQSHLARHVLEKPLGGQASP
jgi:GNAT superfamily N-acetyltransferase